MFDISKTFDLDDRNLELQKLYNYSNRGSRHSWRIVVGGRQNSITRTKIRSFDRTIPQGSIFNTIAYSLWE